MKTDPDLSLPEKPMLRARSITQAVVNCWGVSWKAITGPSRQQSLSTARRVCGYLLRTRTVMSLEEIGKLCGKRDHSTVIYWVGKTKRERAENPALAAMVRSIEDQAERIEHAESLRMNEEVAQ